MESLIELLGEYNVLNRLFPGVLFYSFCSEFWKQYMTVDNQLAQVIVWYFVGMAIDRFGSLVVEKTLKYFKVVKFADYYEYKKAEEKDGKKLNLLNQVNNMYRGMIALMIFLVLSYACDEAFVYIVDKWGTLVLKNLISIILWLAFFAFFVFAYQKQTEYIVKTVKYNNPTSENSEITIVEKHSKNDNL